ncbi:hypothetical protein V6N11_019081 [Hibiscus sabdariffa]|uniref:Uncharacterized protein n=1 Tax=Hibiscus sabdariffa TaxID=183260 RepID=A0ABR2R1E2_9ROSI
MLKKFESGNDNVLELSLLDKFEQMFQPNGRNRVYNLYKDVEGGNCKMVVAANERAWRGRGQFVVSVTRTVSCIAPFVADKFWYSLITGI